MVRLENRRTWIVGGVPRTLGGSISRQVLALVGSRQDRPRINGEFAIGPLVGPPRLCASFALKQKGCLWPAEVAPSLVARVAPNENL